MVEHRTENAGVPSSNLGLGTILQSAGGTVDELVEVLRSRRDRYGISYVIVPGEAAESFAPVVARLAGT